MAIAVAGRSGAGVRTRTSRRSAAQPLVVHPAALVTIAALALAAATVIATAGPLRQTLRGLSLVARAAHAGGAVGRFAEWNASAITERPMTLPVGATPIRACVYLPAHSTQTVLMVPGLHPAGIDEPRFVTLARAFARSGVTVVTPDIPDLAAFRISAVLTDRIEAAARWLAIESGLAPEHRVGLLGISFSGSLCVVAAGRPSLAPYVTYVFAFGGYSDLPRELAYLVAHSNDGAHGYGVAIAMLAVADQLVPADEQVAFRGEIQRFLMASYQKRLDEGCAEEQLAEVAGQVRRLPRASRQWLGRLLAGDAALGSDILPLAVIAASAPALSPERSVLPSVPVFLLHGATDRVIVSSESLRLAARLRAEGVPVRVLLTTLLSHASLDQPVQAGEVWRLASFWGDILSQ